MGLQRKFTNSQLVGWRFSVSGSYSMHGGPSFSVAANASRHDRGIWGEVVNGLGGGA